MSCPLTGSSLPKSRYGDIVDPDAMKGQGDARVDRGPLVYGSTNHGKLTADEYKKQYRVRLHQWGSSTHACVLPEKIWRFNASRPRRSAGSGSHFMAPTADSAVVVGGSLLKVVVVVCVCRRREVPRLSSTM